MTHDIGRAVVFFVAFFASLGGLLAVLYYLEASIDGQVRGAGVDRADERRSAADSGALSQPEPLHQMAASE